VSRVAAEVLFVDVEGLLLGVWTDFELHDVEAVVACVAISKSARVIISVLKRTHLVESGKSSGDSSV
jgi:hypothetical protein